MNECMKEGRKECYYIMSDCYMMKIDENVLI